MTRFSYSVAARGLVFAGNPLLKRRWTGHADRTLRPRATAWPARFSVSRYRLAGLLGLATLLSAVAGTPAIAQITPPAGGAGFQSPGLSPDGSATSASPGATPNALRSVPAPAGSNRSLPARNAAANGAGAAYLGNQASPSDRPYPAGQKERVFDLRPYTGYLTRHDHPEQAVVDWVLRETGTDVWFTRPFGYMNASRDQLTVLHTPEMMRVVEGVVERFVAGEKDPQMMHLRVMTVGNPNWRARTHMLMQHVNVDSPGVQAWLLSKENAALVLNMLRARSDARQVQDITLPVHNGQTEHLYSTKGRNYVRNVRQAAGAWPPYEPETGEIQEGYRLSLSPLLSVDGKTLDCVIKADIDQVDKLNHVNLQLPLPNGQTHRTRIDVPQVVSWRLHERFRWPTDKVLLLSCGVVASPERSGNGVPLLSNMAALTGSTPGRADALMFLEHRGRATENLATVPAVGAAAAPAIATRPGPGTTRGRY